MRAAPQSELKLRPGGRTKAFDQLEQDAGAVVEAAAVAVAAPVVFGIQELP